MGSIMNSHEKKPFQYVKVYVYSIPHLRKIMYVNWSNKKIRELAASVPSCSNLSWKPCFCSNIPHGHVSCLHQKMYNSNTPIGQLLELCNASSIHKIALTPTQHFLLKEVLQGKLHGKQT